VISRFRALATFDGTTVVDTERASALAQSSQASLGEGDGDGAEAEAEAGAEGGEGEEKAPPPPPPIDPDQDASFSLKFTLGMVEGLKDPNPAPPELPEGEEEPDPPRREVVLYDFYVENPPSYYLEISLPNLPATAARTEKRPWAQTPRAEDAAEEEEVMDFQFEKTVMFEASPRTLEWLRYEGVLVQLFQERLKPPPEPEPPAEEEEEGEGEGEGEEEAREESAAAAGDAEGGEEEEKPPEVIITPLARATIDTDALVSAGAVVRLKAELEKYDEAMVTVRPVNDKMVRTFAPDY
jgi:hypothetical protein